MVNQPGQAPNNNNKDMDIPEILNKAKDMVLDHQGHMVTNHNQDHQATVQMDHQVTDLQVTDLQVTDLQVTDLQVTDLLVIMDFNKDFDTQILEDLTEAKQEESMP